MWGYNETEKTFTLPVWVPNFIVDAVFALMATTIWVINLLPFVHVECDVTQETNEEE